MDKLKQHIQRNREMLDTKNPSENIWASLEKELTSSNQKIISIEHFRWLAAAIVLFVFIGAIWVMNNKQQLQPTADHVAARQSAPHETRPSTMPGNILKNDVSQTESSSKKNEQLVKQKEAKQKPANTHASDEEVDNTLHSLQTSFVNIINLQKSKINSTPIYAEGPAYFKDFSLRLRQMDNDEREIKKQITKYGLTDELLEQLINVYQQKLNVLKLLQTEINKTNSRYLQVKPFSETTKTSFLNI